jgi:hypothetical protein
MERAEFFSLPRQSSPRARPGLNGIGDVVRHCPFAFRGVVFDIDPVFATQSVSIIPEDIRPSVHSAVPTTPARGKRGFVLRRSCRQG